MNQASGIGTQPVGARRRGRHDRRLKTKPARSAKSGPRNRGPPRRYGDERILGDQARPAGPRLRQLRRRQPGSAQTVLRFPPVCHRLHCLLRTSDTSYKYEPFKPLNQFRIRP